jgi:hypothetical protein
LWTGEAFLRGRAGTTHVAASSVKCGWWSWQIELVYV